MSAGPPTAPTALAAQHLRLFALLVDTLLVLVLVNLADRLLLGAQWDLRPASGTHGVVLLLAGAALLALRDAAGNSPGRWFTATALGRAADPATPPPLAARVLRALPLLLAPVEAVLVFSDPYCRRLGDRLAGTVVVARAQPAPATRRLLGMVILFFSTLLAISLAEYWNVRRSAAYPLARELAGQDARVRDSFGLHPTYSAPGLDRSRDGRDMRVLLTLEGERGMGEVTVHLRLASDSPRWELVALTVTPPAESKAPQQAPPQPQVSPAPPVAPAPGAPAR